MALDIDIVIVCLFLLTTLAVGLKRGQKVETIEDYALGGRNFTTAALVATIVATWIGGGSFSITLTKTYESGLYYMIPSYGMAISFIISAYLFIPKMTKFLGKLSIAEAIGDLYGDKTRIIVAVAGIMASTGSVAMQFKVFGGLVSHFLSLSPVVGVLIAASIVTLYSAFGGIKAVTFTDILQAITFGFAIPIIGVMIWNHVYDSDILLINSISDSKFDIDAFLFGNNTHFMAMITLMFYYALPGMEPAIFQRISMGRDVWQVKRVFIIAASLVLCLELIMQWVPFLLFNLNPTLTKEELFGYLIDNYTYVGFKGLILSGIVAMAMSTADSMINSASVLFAHDICKPLNIKVKSELLISKLFALCLGICGIIFALKAQNLLDIILMANSFYMPVVTVPAMLMILGFRTTKLSIWLAMGSGFGTVLIWNYMEIEADPIAFAMLINLVVLLASHYLLRQPGGWIETKEDIPEDVNNISIIARIKSAFNVYNWVKYCKEKVPSDETSYVGLGVYFVIYTFTTMYTTRGDLPQESTGSLLVMYQIMMITGTLMMMYPIWPLRFKAGLRESFGRFCWPVSIFYMLVFFSSFFVMINNFGPLQFVIFTINTILVVLLVGWKASILMIPTGFYASLECYKYYKGIEHIDFSTGSPQSIFMYSLVLIGAVLLIFLKPKQDYLEETENQVEHLAAENTHLGYELNELFDKNHSLDNKIDHYSKRLVDKDKEIERLSSTAQRILNNVNHELRLPVGNVMNFAEMLSESLEKFKPEQVKMLSDEVYKNSNRLSTMILNMLDLATLNANNIELEKTPINFSELVKTCVTNSRKIYIENKKIDFDLSIVPEIITRADPNYMRQVIDNLVINAITFSDSGTVKVSLQCENSTILFSITDEGKGIPKEELYDIFIPFKMGSNTESKAEGRGVGLALCKAAVESHGGKINAFSDGKRGATISFSLPII